jgi:hypothetical protein
MPRSFAVTLLLCVTAFGQPAADRSLGFYIVSEEARPGLHLFDSATFPKLGYIGHKPDLSISRLEAVSIGTYRDRSRIVHSDGSAEQANEDRPALNIRLTDADAKSLEALTSAHRGSQMLLMLGDEPLFAPFIHMPINTQAFQITLRPGADAEKLKQRLEAFVRSPQ